MRPSTLSTLRACASRTLLISLSTWVDRSSHVALACAPACVTASLTCSVAWSAVFEIVVMGLVSFLDAVESLQRLGSTTRASQARLRARATTCVHGGRRTRRLEGHHGRT